jgi:TRAP transporter TAXI family solute receptor
MSITPSRWWAVFVALLALAALLGAWKLLKPSAPTRVVMVTGSSGGAYASLGKRYVEIFKREGVTLELRETKGSVENLELLKRLDNDIEAGFVQSGITPEPQREGLISLGSLFYEPLWIFYRDKGELDRITQLRGKRLGVGAVGSGTRPVVQALLGANNMANGDTKLDESPPKDAAAKLQRGELDAIFLIAGADSPLVVELLSAKDVKVMSMARADAYSRIMPSLAKITIPRGVINLTADIPSQSIDTVAATATLVAMDSLHPAIAYLFIKAAKEVHGDGGLLHAQREFPSIAKYQEFDVPENVEQLYKNGTPFLYRYLPFGWANLVMRLWVLLIPLGAVMLSASDLVPKLMGAKMGWRISKIYADARSLEWEIMAAKELDADALRKFGERLAQLNARADALKGPSSTAKVWYELRSHLQLVDDRLASLRT